MTTPDFTDLNDTTRNALRKVRESIPAVRGAYEQRRTNLVAMVGQTSLHEEIRQRARAQLLLLDVSGEQWQALVTSLADRIEALHQAQASLLASAPSTINAIAAKVAAARQQLNKKDPRAIDDANWLGTVSGVRADMTHLGAWLGPWTEALVALQFLQAQSSYLEVLTASDSRVAKAAAITAIKKGIDFVPILGPILTGSADAYDVANTRAQELETASDELTRLDEFIDALSHMALLFEALLATPSSVNGVMALPDAAELRERIGARQRRILASQAS